jgi:hypothetical protein
MDVALAGSNIDQEKLLASWRWLVENAEAILVTKLGDVFLKTRGSFYLLEVNGGKLEKVADSVEELDRLLESDPDQYLSASLVERFRSAGLGLGAGQCIGFKIPTVLSGEFSVDNAYAADPYDYLGALGDIHLQIKNFPNGTKVRLVTK